MREFIRDNVAFVAKGSKFDSLNQKCTLVEYFPSQGNEDTGKCIQIMMELDEAEKLHAFLGVWLTENTYDTEDK
jgi:hypothetical protein